MTLPQPDPAFHWVPEVCGHVLRCEPLAAIAQHAFTTKQLQLRGGPEAQPLAWAQAVAAVGGGLEQLMRVTQVHGVSIRVLERDEIDPRAVADKPHADAIVSNASGLVLSVQVADCVAILVADAVSGAAAAIHAGWRGTCAGVAIAAVRAMARELGARPADMIAALGPSIGPCCYTVGPTVRDQFTAARAESANIGRWFVAHDGETLRLDLWRANYDQLISAGLREDRVHVSRLCTQTHHEVFESYRVDGERAGRMAGLIAVP